MAQDASQHGAGISVVYKEFEEYLDGDAVGPGKELRFICWDPVSNSNNRF